MLRTIAGIAALAVIPFTAALGLWLLATSTDPDDEQLGGPEW